MKNYKTLIISIVAVLAVVLLCVFIPQHFGNRAIALEESVNTTQSDIDTQLQRRFNVLTELAECVKQYDSHEYETLTKVIEARGANISEQESEQVVAQINAVAESYPKLKSQENYKQFMNEIATTENLLAQYKQAYNASVKNYNRYVKKFPNRQCLSLIGYEVVSYEYYKTDKTDNEAMQFFD